MQNWKAKARVRGNQWSVPKHRQQHQLRHPELSEERKEQTMNTEAFELNRPHQTVVWEFEDLKAALFSF